MSSFIVNAHSLTSNSSQFLLDVRLIQQKNNLISPSIIFQSQKKNLCLRKIVRTPEAALVEAQSIKVVEEKPLMLNMKATVTVRNSRKVGIMDMILSRFDGFIYPAAAEKGVVLQLMSTELDPKTMEPKLSKEAVLDLSKSLKVGTKQNTYQVEFKVESDFGVPGAITVYNKYPKEFFLVSISFERFVHFACNSWVQPANVHSNKRIFFTNKAYLPCTTPLGLNKVRAKELQELRGDGKGLRLPSDRIYDYDMYNDLGNPDKGTEYSRPTLGGPENPHPRRCRTGRPSTKTDMNAESPVEGFKSIYVPRDEALEDPKQEALLAGKLKGTLRNIVPSLIAYIHTENDVFKEFSEINSLYKSQPVLKKKSQDKFLNKLVLTKVLGNIQEFLEEIVKFNPPKSFTRDTSWLRDDEFGRQAVAGINPLNIEKLKVFPPVSKLDPSVYGPQESALREEHIIGHLCGMSIQQALDENKLFILDYHDIYLPFLNRINALDDRKAYGTRTIFFLTPKGTLKPIAIELSLPQMDSTSPSKQVLTPPIDATTNWLWQLAKAHVSSNDSGVHQLVNHWLRTHACMEPFIIAAHRQLSVMHPIFKLLDPHMRYTMKINAMARETLINAGGSIEHFFTAGKYCMEISCAAYRDCWRFDLEGLPADLIRRGVATPDPTQPHGLRLFIEDYPYANDGLLIWSAIENLVSEYVNYYYPKANLIHTDMELQAWYNESINVGHADVRDATWWPTLSTPHDLTKILTTIIWLASAQHAALNFGQYPYGGYVPNRSPLMRRLVPQQEDPDWENFVADPQGYFLTSLPSMFQATQFMALLEIISTHSPDEQYIGERQDSSTWSDDPQIIEAFYRFSMEIKKIEKNIEKRNSDPSLTNRCGAGISPYELLMPSSGPGVTCKGVPNSITV
ncbi:unnamed protein product [Camellia sinensis]